MGSDGCMGSGQSAKVIEGTWVGLLTGARGSKWTTEVQNIKNSKQIKYLSYQLDDLQAYFEFFFD